MKTLRLVLADASSVVVTIMAMFMGVGQFSAEGGLSALQTGLMTALTVSGPAQAAAAQMMASGGASSGLWLAAIMTVIVVNLRFAVLTASVLARLPDVGRLRSAPAISLITAGSFAVVLPRLMSDRVPQRPVFYCALVTTICTSSAVIGALLGHGLAGIVPAAIGLALSAIIPVYFATLIARMVRHRTLMANAAAGAILVPLAAPFLGSLTLLVVPLVIAAVSFLVERKGRHDA
ncbi:AzlC family ABC transporter permease [Consotaella aegiceratis]|uniref:AzlC family ABC transporter permease n=1 Tax=Consotaella aegiceratis TaxID=3097961 RepID=UPI002F3F5DF0